MSTPHELPTGQSLPDAQIEHAGGGPTPEQAIQGAALKGSAPVRAQTPADQFADDTQSATVSGNLFSTSAGPEPSVFHGGHASTGRDLSTPEQAISPPLPISDVSARAQTPVDQRGVDTHRRSVSGTQHPPAEVMLDAVPRAQAPRLADPLLAFHASVLDDLETVRIANENRLRMMTRSVEDSDGGMRGMGLPANAPEVRAFAVSVEGLQALEHQAELNLKRAMRKHPLGPWVGQMRGVGEKQAARLLAVVRDPYWNDLHERPRKVSELWSYCGYGDARRQVRKRGELGNWSPEAKMRAHLVAVSCMKTTGHYRDVYEAARAKYADTLHPTECKRCGPAGHPAQPGSPRSAGHQHAMALRKVAKEVLKDLWREAKRLHEEAS